MQTPHAKSIYYEIFFNTPFEGDNMIKSDNVYYCSDDLGWGLQCNILEDNPNYKQIRKLCDEVISKIIEIEKLNRKEETAIDVEK